MPAGSAHTNCGPQGEEAASGRRALGSASTATHEPAVPQWGPSVRVRARNAPVQTGNLRASVFLDRFECLELFFGSICATLPWDLSRN